MYASIFLHVEFSTNVYKEWSSWCHTKEAISVYIFNLHWYAASRKLMMTWSFLSKFVFYQTSFKNCLVNFLQWNARRLIFSNSSSVRLGGKSHSPITNDDFCLHNGRERKWLLSPAHCSRKHYKNTIQVGSKHQTIKTGGCSILHLPHSPINTYIEKQWGIFISPLCFSSSFFKFSLAIVRER